jgi:CBS-domain-containing membrane protein
MRYYKSFLKLALILSTSTVLFANDDAIKLETGKTLLEAIHNDEIRSIMRQLNTLAYEREYTELELRKLNKRQVKLLVKEAAALADTTANLTNITSFKNLDDETQLAFNAMVNQLQNISEELRNATENNHQDEIDTAYIKLQETCNTCHTLFREE